MTPMFADRVADFRRLSHPVGLASQRRLLRLDADAQAEADVMFVLLPNNRCECFLARMPI